MLENFKTKLGIFRKKLAGARKSIVFWTIAVWQMLIQVWTNLVGSPEMLQAMLPQLPMFFSAHFVSIISAVAGVIFLYARFFRPNVPLQDKCKNGVCPVEPAAAVESASLGKPVDPSDPSNPVA